MDLINNFRISEDVSLLILNFHVGKGSVLNFAYGFSALTVQLWQVLQNKSAK